MFGGITCDLYPTSSSNIDIDLSNSRAAIRYVERQHMTCSFRGTSVHCKYTQNVMFESGCNACLGSKFADSNSHPIDVSSIVEQSLDG